MFRVILNVCTIFLVCVQADSLLEGAACDAGGVQGTCRKAASCPSYAVLARYHENPEVTICSKNGNEEVVCCTDCKIDDVSKAAVTLDGVVWKTGGVRKFYDKCVDYASSLPYPCKDGKKVTPKKVYDAEKKCHHLDVDVVQDNEAAAVERVDFPYLALLGYTYNATVPPHWNCQGFIISERFIITTAHCRNDRVNGPASVIAVGVNKRTDDSEHPVPTPTSWQLYKVKQYIAHPDWHSPAKYNDIALVETDRDIEFSVNVLPLCLSEQSSVPETVHADLLGIDGVHENEKVNIQKLDEKECSSLFSPSRHLKDGIDFEKQACYKGFNEQKKVCWGSSGRPIYIPGDLKCMSYTVGFTSFGLACYHGNETTVYTRIHAYLPWIESIVWPSS